MDLNAEVREIWNRNAAWWDEKVGSEGNATHRVLVAPATERLLQLRPGETVLDIACGNGQFARRMADLGAHVVAFDFSEVFVERARAHSTDYRDRIEYLVLDATDPSALRSFGKSRFDAAICTMALMDIADLGPLATVLPEFLKPGGRFVFSVTHPCFNTTGAQRFVEEAHDGGVQRTVYGVKVTAYLTPAARLGVGIAGQPAPQYYFERPLNVLLRPFFEAGFVLDGLEEPAWTSEDARPGLSWRNAVEIPELLVVRLRPR